MARNHKGEMVVSESDGWRYIPLRGKESFNVCDETKPRGTQFNCLWSILAQGGLVGRYYSDVGIESYAVWTSDSPTESISYSSWMHIGSGIWVTVVVHVSDREVEDSGCEVVRKLEARSCKMHTRRRFCRFVECHSDLQISIASAINMVESW